MEGRAEVGGDVSMGLLARWGLSVIFVDCELSLPLWSAIRGFGASCSPTCRQLSGRRGRTASPPTGRPWAAHAWSGCPKACQPCLPPASGCATLQVTGVSAAAEAGLRRGVLSAQEVRAELPPALRRALPAVSEGPRGARAWLTCSSLGLCPPHTAPPARRHFEKSTETRPHLTRRAGLACERSSCVSARPEPSFPLCVLIGWCRLLPGRLPREGATLVPGLPLPSVPPRCPSMLGDHSSLPADRALLSQPRKTGLSCKMVLQAVGRVLR